MYMYVCISHVLANVRFVLMTTFNNSYVIITAPAVESKIEKQCLKIKCRKEVL